MPNTTAPKLDIFIAYAPEDIVLRQELEEHLSDLQRQGYINIWHDDKMVIGQNRAETIKQQLQKAKLILLLISSDFMSSPQFYTEIIQPSLTFAKTQNTVITPILLRPYSLEFSPLNKLKALPANKKAVTSWENHDAAFVSIIQDLHQIIDQQSQPDTVSFTSNKPTPSSQTNNGFQPLYLLVALVGFVFLLVLLLLVVAQLLN